MYNKTMHKYIISIWGLLFITCFPLVGYSQDEKSATKQPLHLQVSTIHRPPFAMVGQNGLEGFSVDLWEEIAQNNNWSYDYVVHDSFVAMLAAVKKPGDSDLAIANISITNEREEIMDFSTEIYSGGLQILLTTQSWRIVEYILQDRRIQLILGVLCLVFVLSGWLINRISTTAVWRYSLWQNYGHLLALGYTRPPLPKTDPARIILRIWNITFLVLVTLLIVEIVNLTIVATKDPETITTGDLERRLVGVTEGSAAENFLRKQQIPTVSYRSSRALFGDVQNGTIDAAVHDAPVIQHHINTSGQMKQQAVVAGAVFSQDRYGIALPTDSVLRETINQSIEEMKQNGRYTEIYRQWFGE